VLWFCQCLATCSKSTATINSSDNRSQGLSKERLKTDLSLQALLHSCQHAAWTATWDAVTSWGFPCAKLSGGYRCQDLSLSPGQFCFSHIHPPTGPPATFCPPHSRLAHRCPPTTQAVNSPEREHRVNACRCHHLFTVCFHLQTHDTGHNM
jgi:hypothetical protein